MTVARGSLLTRRSAPLPSTTIFSAPRFAPDDSISATGVHRDVVIRGKNNVRAAQYLAGVIDDDIVGLDVRCRDPAGDFPRAPDKEARRAIGTQLRRIQHHAPSRSARGLRGASAIDENIFLARDIHQPAQTPFDRLRLKGSGNRQRLGDIQHQLPAICRRPAARVARGEVLVRVREVVLCLVVDHGARLHLEGAVEGLGGPTSLERAQFIPGDNVRAIRFRVVASGGSADSGHQVGARQQRVARRKQCIDAGLQRPLPTEIDLLANLQVVVCIPWITTADIECRGTVVRCVGRVGGLHSRG